MFRYLLILAALVWIYSCQKESFNTSADALLTISTDSLKFDTVFTGAGSITKSFKIKNENEQKLLLNSVKLMGGSNSAFSINVNGQATREINNLEMEAGDSIYVFVSVNVNPNAQNTPFIVSDSIRISYNGQQRFVQLEAFGQNAHYLRNQTIRGQETWTNDLPYVILGSLNIDTTAQLTIEQGCRIYVHANAPIIVNGSLQANGSKDNEIIIKGDRLDAYYNAIPGAWPGLVFSESSRDNVLRFVNINNATRAVVVNEPASNNLPKLTMHQCIVDNALTNGIQLFHSSMLAENCLISNCKKNLEIIAGGDYSFVNCTFASYSNNYMLHTLPVLQATDINPLSSNTNATEDLNVKFTNCIFWGDGGTVSNELLVNRFGSTLFDMRFDHCIYKNETDPADAVFNTCLNGTDPLFDSIDVVRNYYDFRTFSNQSAPGIDNGTLTSYPKDLDNQNRVSGNATDIGCYEKQ